MSPSGLEFLINLIGEKFSKNDTPFWKAISVQERLALTLRFDKFHDTCLNPLHITVTERSTNPQSAPYHSYRTLKKPHSTADSHHSSRQEHQE